MRIGILTLHDSINYGALLQAYAMSRVYRSMGHEVRLIDRRRDRRGWALKWELSALSPWGRLAWFLNATGIWAEWCRRRRSLEFLRQQVGMSDYHFSRWADAPSDLGVDLISIGSDQVWNSGIHDPLDYLPGRIPVSVPTISYAASVGMKDLPEDLKDSFREGVKRLRAVSVRERNAVDILSEFGVEPTVVIDPVVLAGRAAWDELIQDRPQPGGRIVVYLLGVHLQPILDELADYVRSTGSEIDVFVGRLVVEPLTRRGHPRLFKNLKFWRRYRRVRGLHVRLSDGPEEFVAAIASARAVITSSYHALLFSVLYGRNVRFIVPDAATPQAGMMVRVNDYAGEIIRGPLLQPDVETALESLAEEPTTVDTARLEDLRKRSREWLEAAL